MVLGEKNTALRNNVLGSILDIVAFEGFDRKREPKVSDFVRIDKSGYNFGGELGTFMLINKLLWHRFRANGIDRTIMMIFSI
jgi:hypothetical protein